jgi:beta-mannosidase
MNNVFARQILPLTTEEIHWFGEADQRSGSEITADGQSIIICILPYLSRMMKFLSFVADLFHSITGWTAGFLLTLSTLVYSQTDTLWLTENWTLRATDGSSSVPARVPGYVPLDLQASGQLPALFSPEFEELARKACTRTWVYETEFKLDSARWLSPDIMLLLEGVDTYADVFVNGHWAGRCGNMFAPFSFSIKPLVYPGRNSLSVSILPVEKVAGEQYAEQGDSLPEGPRVMARKAQYMFGWDWAPGIPAAGIWKDVGLLFKQVNHANLEMISTGLKDDLINGYIKGTYSIESADPGSYVAELVMDDILLCQDNITCGKGRDTFSFEQVIENPEKWWPRSHGEPGLYPICFRIRDPKGEIILDECRHMGFRQVILKEEVDRKGKSFAFEVNGKPVFMKGANWIPLHFFPSEADDTSYRTLLQMAADAHINMLRVWGGGIYEKDIFYHLCDSLGIMVWQDFMFACAMYPDNPGFLASVEREALHQIRRLNAHPCLALWCGNNEVAEGWSNWGWKKGRSEAAVLRIQGAYDALFKGLLPDLVRQWADGVSYWESSPKYGRGSKPYLYEGDAHDWYVWHDGYPFSHFLENVPRFMSEFGFQSYPSLHTMQAFVGSLPPGTLPAGHWKRYQKHARGAALIQEYLTRDYPAPSNPEEWVYLSQVMQARGISDAILAHRKAAPYCMGSLFWQWNDCWPAVSWSAVDFMKQPKAMYYYSRRAFLPELLHMNSAYEVQMITDLPASSPISWKLFAAGEKGGMYGVESGKTHPGSKPKKVFRSSGRKNPPPWLALQYQPGEKVETQVIVPAGLQTWRVLKEELDVVIEEGQNGLKVSVTAQTPLIGCRIDYPGLSKSPEDNFIDLLPGQTYTWWLSSKMKDPRLVSVMALGPP